MAKKKPKKLTKKSPAKKKPKKKSRAKLAAKKPPIKFPRPKDKPRPKQPPPKKPPYPLVREAEMAEGASKSPFDFRPGNGIGDHVQRVKERRRSIDLGGLSKPPKMLFELLVHVNIATEDAHGLADESVSTIYIGEPTSDRLKAEFGAYPQLASGGSVETLDVIDDLKKHQKDLETLIKWLGNEFLIDKL